MLRSAISIYDKAYYRTPQMMKRPSLERRRNLKPMPGGADKPYTRLFIVTQENCINCPAAKAAVNEAVSDMDYSYEEIDLLNMDPDFEFRLLENQIFIASTPSIILDKQGALELLYSGSVPSVEDIRQVLRGSD